MSKAIMNDHLKKALIFGARGMLGSATVDSFTRAGFGVTGVTSRQSESNLITITEDLDQVGTSIATLPVFDAVVWAHGINLNDRCDNVEIDDLRRVIDINVLYIARTLAALLKDNKIANGARLVVISSIWQEVARQGKYSYSISKAAVGGLVRVASADLAERGVLVNAILPGVLDGPMTRSNLSPNQLENVVTATDFGRLADAKDVAELALFLCSDSNRSITGQSISVDLGFSNLKRL